MFSDGKLYLRETGEFNETNLLCGIFERAGFLLLLYKFLLSSSG